MQFGQLKRRKFITLLGGAAAWPLAAAQQEMPVIGLLCGGTPDSGCLPSDRIPARLMEKGCAAQ
jgi:hypothetical protein